MKSFYELLGASADDDGEALKKAFRKAVKAHHPDLHPTDPDAPLRFRQIVAANALLRDAKQRAIYDRMLQLERQQFRLEVECQQLRSKLERERLRLNRMRTTVAVATVGAMLGGYWFFAPMPTTAIVEITKDEHAATTGARIKNDRQTVTVAETVEKDKDAAPVIAADKETENTSTAIAAAATDAVKSNMDNAGEPLDTAGAQQMAQAKPENRAEHEKPENRGEPSHRRVDTGVPAGVIKLTATASATNHSDAEVIVDRELAPGPLSNDANFYREQGITFYRNRDFAPAIVNFDEAIRLDPNDAQAYNIRGNTWDEMGMFEHALADYEEAIRIDPNNPAVFHDRAILWQHQGALDKALVDLDRAIRFSFTDAHTYCDRGLVWYEKGRHSRAIADFNQAIKLDPNFAAACINRGLILHGNREFTVAFADSKPIRVDPSIFDVTKRITLRP